MATRYNVVACDGAVVWREMYSADNAQDEADVLNESGLPEGRPYRVEEVSAP